MGEYEPNDSRNITGTASTPDGRFTNPDGAAARPGETQGIGQQRAEELGLTGQAGAATGGDGSMAGLIRPHMAVVDDGGRQVGTVDHMEDGRIKLTRSGSTDGQHHHLSLDQIDRVEDGRVCLRAGGGPSSGSGSI